MHLRRFVQKVLMAAGLTAMIVVSRGGSVLWADQNVCDCPFPGDASGDGVIDVMDVVATLDLVFSFGPVVQDPNCPKPRADANADGVVDARDVVFLRDHILYGLFGPVNPCDCAANPPLCEPLVDPNPGATGNSVVVESKTVIAGQPGVTIAIRITNLAELQYLVVPLMARSLVPGAFMSKVQMNFGDRLAGEALDFGRFRNVYSDQNGTCGPQGFGMPSVVVPHTSVFAPQAIAASPAGFLFGAGGCLCTGTYLPAGSDAGGSMILTADMTATPGSFEIDTTCTSPANHLVFILAGSSAAPIVPAFTKGVITLVQNQIPVAQCQDRIVPAGIDCTAGVSVDNGSYDPDGGDLTLTQIPPGPYEKGVTPVTLIVSDVIGSKDTCQATVTVIDATPPVLACPDSVSIRIGPADTGAVITYAATATDNCPGLTLVCTPPPGSYFLRGATPVTCIATDAAGLADTCQFVVSVFNDCFDRLSDVNCDGVIDVMDVVLLIDIAFANAAQIPCPAPK